MSFFFSNEVHEGTERPKNGYGTITILLYDNIYKDHSINKVNIV